ncbi:Alpha-1,2-mannosyltransferase ALG9 [Hypsibius exemplaris]|uniref:Mannosyltransferase n=1 Tax=Hypsibius exemplaris TaxID=2072580 RepID=A0A1W0WYK5_HYPEX|nr:Alpha-1,2-mannosyltransferase ALG9 [Hypsibius exemplaris]
MSSRRFKKERHPFAYHPEISASTSAAHQSHSLSGEDDTGGLDRLQRRDWRIAADVGDAEDTAENTSLAWRDAWTPEIRTAVKLLLSARLCSVVWSHITDCDETFNYWEPLHYILHGSGFQTWEYSPSYAIRSYAYLLLHALPLKLYDVLFHPDRLLMFYLLRLLLAVVSVGIEGYFYDAVRRKFGPSVARLLLIFQLFAPAFFISSTALLPSSFAMSMTMLAFAFWFREREMLAVTAVACSGLLGWPFAAVLGLPIALDILTRRGLLHFLTRTLLIGGTLTAAIIGIDSNFYGKLVFPSLNIVLYNVISGHGPELYGTEPWHFYVINGFLNFNVAFFLALLCPVVGEVGHRFRRHLPESNWHSRVRIFRFGTCVAVAIWLGILFSTPHKEERFLFPVYSLLALLAAITLDLLTQIGTVIAAKIFPAETSRSLMTRCLWVVLIVSALLGTSRMFALSRYYGAPMEIYTKLHLEAANRTTTQPLIEQQEGFNLCVGKEWHRFPSSFFLPDQWQLQFIQSDFKGVLPKPFAPYPQGLSAIPTEMNDENREEPSRYIDVCRCHYLVDLNFAGKSSPLEPQYLKNKSEWTVVHRENFLDSERSHRLYRAFYIPFLSEKHCSFADYVLLRRKRKCPPAETEQIL